MVNNIALMDTAMPKFYQKALLKILLKYKCQVLAYLVRKFSSLIQDRSQVNFIFCNLTLPATFFLNRKVFVFSLSLIKLRTPGVQIGNLPSLSPHAFSNDPLANLRDFQLVQLTCFNFFSSLLFKSKQTFLSVQNSPFLYVSYRPHICTLFRHCKTGEEKDSCL